MPSGITIVTVVLGFYRSFFTDFVDPPKPNACAVSAGPSAETASGRAAYDVAPTRERASYPGADGLKTDALNTSASQVHGCICKFASSSALFVLVALSKRIGNPHQQPELLPEPGSLRNRNLPSAVAAITRIRRHQPIGHSDQDLTAVNTLSQARQASKAHLLRHLQFSQIRTYSTQTFALWHAMTQVDVS